MWTISECKDWHFLDNKFEWVRRMTDVPQDPRYHSEGNVAIHTRMVLAALVAEPAFDQLSKSDQEIIWAAALLHDVEKYSTTNIDEDGSITANGHARKGAQFARQLLYMFEPASFEIREQIVGLVRHHGLPIWLFEKADPLKALVKASLEVDTKLLALLARADVIGRYCTDKDEMLYRVDCFEDFCRENNCWGKPFEFKSVDSKMYYLSNENAYIDFVPFDKPKTEVILMSGLPGSGKDTFIKKNYRNWPIVSLDQMRADRKISPTDKTGNGQVIQGAKEQAKIYLRKHQSFVWNATNITTQMRTQLIGLFMSYNARVNIVYVEVPYQLLKSQNKAREAFVPGSVMEKLSFKLEVPLLWEAHYVNYRVL